MPAKPNYRKRDHPSKMTPVEASGAMGRHGARRPRYAELCCKSNFSFLRGASHPEELAKTAASLGYAALAVTDRNTLAGVVRMHCAAKACELKLIVGAEMTPVDAPPVTLYATDRGAYGRLCRIITQGRLREKKGHCAVTLADIAERNEGLMATVAGAAILEAAPVFACQPNGKISPPHNTASGGLRVSNPSPTDWLGVYRDMFGDRLYLAASVHGGADDERRLAKMDALARSGGVPMIATNDVYYHQRESRFLQDVLTCIREHYTLEEAGRKLFANAERHLKPIDDMQRLFLEYPQAMARTMEIADRCHFSLDELRYEYPEALCPPDRSPTEYLAALTWAGARERYPEGLPEKVRRLIDYELKLIHELAYEPYFLTVWDIVRFARSCDILCQGRGSAANSAVCYCLGITSVDPDRAELLFERFVSAERNEPPDIDVDFEHERREEVFQYIYNKYGREHAGIVAEVITYRPRSAIRDVGKVLGLSLDRIGALAKKHEWWDHDALPADFVREVGFDPGDRTLRMLRKLIRRIVGFPRHLSQHVGGFVITRGPLCEMVPIENGAMENRTFIEWDKDDIDALGILKIDCLALGMLTAIHKCFGLIADHASAAKRSESPIPAGVAYPAALHEVPPEDPIVYDMVCHADTVGVFQIESRAQMSMLPRLKPRTFYDLVIEVAIVRPGPIQGGMVHPYLRRRAGEEPVTYPSDAIKGVLKRTLGVPLFQEQAMRLAVVAAGFTPGEADQLRRAMGAWRRNGDIAHFNTRLIEGMKANGLSEEFAERCYKQICGFGEYGFPESHAASFALLVYVSAWLKRYHPAGFCAAILNSLPMGFYQPAQLVRDAREHGVRVLPVDVNHSGYDCRLTDRSPSPAPRHADGPNHGLQPSRTGEGNRANGHPRTHLRKVASNRAATVRERSYQRRSRREQPLPYGRGSEKKEPFKCALSATRPTPRRLGVFSNDPSLWGIDGPAVRLGMRLVKGISQAKVEGIQRARRDRPFTSVADLAHRSGMSRATLARLAAADAMRSLGLDRRQALWQVLALGVDPPMFVGQEPDEPTARLPKASLADVVLADYDTMGLSLNAHPISLIRRDLTRLRVQTAQVLKHARKGQWMRVGGLVLVRQRPSTAAGIVFCTLEDETGVANLIIRPSIYERFRRTARGAVALLAEGRVERQGEVVHLQTARLEDLSKSLTELGSVSRDFR